MALGENAEHNRRQETSLVSGVGRVLLHRSSYGLIRTEELQPAIVEFLFYWPSGNRHANQPANDHRPNSELAADRRFVGTGRAASGSPAQLRFAETFFAQPCRIASRRIQLHSFDLRREAYP